MCYWKIAFCGQLNIARSDQSSENSRLFTVMATILEGHEVGRGLRIAVAVARFNQEITESLLQGSLRTLRESGVADDAITVARVPGAFELPMACEKLALTNKFDAVIALGAVIRGDTPHFDYICAECARGLMTVSLQHKLPVVFGVLTTDSMQQAWHRAAPDTLQSSHPVSGGEISADDPVKVTPRSNKGAEAAQVALRMATLFSEIGST